jgi:hypothetical protein
VNVMKSPSRRVARGARSWFAGEIARLLILPGKDAGTDAYGPSMTVQFTLAVTAIQYGVP